MKNVESDTEELELGDVVRFTERHKIIGFEGPDILTLDLRDGSVNKWLNGFGEEVEIEDE